jgi:hypothetical protein
LGFRRKFGMPEIVPTIMGILSPAVGSLRVAASPDSRFFGHLDSQSTSTLSQRRSLP